MLTMVTRVTGLHPKPWLRRDAARDRRPVNAGGESKKESGDPHLRSTGEVIGYSIHANDGDIGHVDDFMIDDNDWIVRYVVITRSWWPGEEGLARAGMDRANPSPFIGCPESITSILRALICWSG